MSIYFAVRRFCFSSQEKALLLTLVLGSFITWGFQGYLHLSESLNFALLFATLATLFQPSSILWITLLALHRLDLAGVCCLIGIQFLLFRKNSRQLKLPDLRGQIRYILAYGVIISCWAAVVAKYIPIDPMAVDQPGICFGYCNMSDLRSFKLIQFSRDFVFSRLFGVTLFLLCVFYRAMYRTQGVRWLPLFLGGVEILLLSLGMGVWKEIRLFGPPLLLIFISLDHSEDSVRRRPTKAPLLTENC